MGTKGLNGPQKLSGSSKEALVGSRRLLAIKGLTQLEVLVTGQVTGSSHAGESTVSRASRSNRFSGQGVEP